MSDCENSDEERNRKVLGNRPQNFDVAKNTSNINGPSLCLRMCGHIYDFPNIEVTMTKNEKSQVEKTREYIKICHDAVCPEKLAWIAQMKNFVKMHPYIDPALLNLGVPVVPEPPKKEEKIKMTSKGTKIGKFSDKVSSDPKEFDQIYGVNIFHPFHTQYSPKNFDAWSAWLKYL